MASKLYSKLKKSEKFVNYGDKKLNDLYYKSTSPAINYLFGKNQGIRAGYSTMIYGPAKCGKSVSALSFIGQLHKDDPDAVAIYFDTELRTNSDTWIDAFGIDRNRFWQIRSNDPTDVFDFIATEVLASLQEYEQNPKNGDKIRMIVIDSLAMLRYPKEQAKELTTDVVIGDGSQYLPGAFKLILPILRKYEISLIACQHVRANMNTMTNKYKPYIIPNGHGLRHIMDYWLFCERITGKNSKVLDADKKDGSGNPIILGHDIRFKMEESSLSPANRSVEVALNYKEGFVNSHYEIATIAKNMNIIERPNNRIYIFNGQQWDGFDAFALAIKADPDLQQQLIKAIQEGDLT